jgi:hypothetical protein
MFEIAPIYGKLCAKGSLVDFVIGWTAADTAEPYALQAKCIGRAKDSADIVLATDIVKHHDEGHFLCFVKCLRCEAIHLLYGSFLHCSSMI